jgi:subtilisin family serine protease
VIVVRFRPGTLIRYEKKAEETTESTPLRDGFSLLKAQFPKATLEPLFTHISPEQLRKLGNPPPSQSGRALLPVDDPTTFYTVRPESGQNIDELIRSLEALPTVAEAYPLRGPCPPPNVVAVANPFAVRQGYINPAPQGIDIFSAQGLPGGFGQDVRFIDIEQGWNLNHEDLIDARVQLLWGINTQYKGHGTAVLGEIAATDNGKGIVGIARDCQASVISQFDSFGNYNTAGAILAAVEHLSPGDVLLLEAQVDQANRPGIYFPVEIEKPVRNAIAIAFNKGIIVIEAAGNGNNRDQGENLDALIVSGRGAVLDRNSHSFMESGAIIVGAAHYNEATNSFTKNDFSNFGNRIDCFAWGDNITTTGDGEDGNDKQAYIHNFGGTSGASPIIAGTAILIQAIQRALGGNPLLPEQMRDVLTNQDTGTLPENPTLDRIGVIPDLRRILQRLFIAPVANTQVAIQ